MGATPHAGPGRRAARSGWTRTETVQLAELAPVVEGKPDVSRLTEIDLEDLGRRYRMQTIVFTTARDVYDQMAPTWPGSARACCSPSWCPSSRRSWPRTAWRSCPRVFAEDPLRRRILLTLNMSRIVRHLWDAIRHENTQALTPVFDGERPVRATGDMLPWYTGSPWADTQRSHVNFCVLDSTWEASEAFHLDHHPRRRGVGQERPPRLRDPLRLRGRGATSTGRTSSSASPSGSMLVLEVKGQDSPQNQAKRDALDEWVAPSTARRLRPLDLGGVARAVGPGRPTRSRGERVAARPP